MRKIMRSQAGFSLGGVIVFILLVAGGIYLVIQLIRPSQASGKFKTAIDGIALSGMNKTDGQIRRDIIGSAGEIGVFLDEDDILITWGPGREFLEITVEYSAPLDLWFFHHDRQFNYLARRELSRPKQIMNQVERSVGGSYNKMVERARQAGQ